MSKLLILCVDGLDPRLASENGFCLPYEKQLAIPKELYWKGAPWTPRVWPSIFAGRIEIFPEIFEINTVRKRIRKGIRKLLLDHGIRWYRSGLKIHFDEKKARSERVYHFIRMKPIVEETVLDNYNSFTYHLPAVSHDYIYGGDNLYNLQEWRQFNLLAMYLISLNFDIAAVYCRIIDFRGHSYIEGNEDSLKKLLHLYREVFYLAETVAKYGDVMLLSDHGTLGGHTNMAYLGCTRPVKAESVLDVREDIERILNEKAKSNIMHLTTARITLNQ